MKFITTIINKLKAKNIQMPLGRWRIENCNTIMSNKIDLSNEDHCGPCGQYALEKVKLKNDIIKDITLEDLKPPLSYNCVKK
jgi:hypothetical protein